MMPRRRGVIAECTIGKEREKQQISFKKWELAIMVGQCIMTRGVHASGVGINTKSGGTPITIALSVMCICTPNACRHSTPLEWLKLPNKGIQPFYFLGGWLLTTCTTSFMCTSHHLLGEEKEMSTRGSIT